jgi:hypothetical protein
MSGWIGIAALLKAQDATRDWRAIRNLILSAGDSLPSLRNVLVDTVTGKRVNAYRSLTCRSARRATTALRPPWAPCI